MTTIVKKRTKSILAFAFLGGIMATSGVVIAIPGMIPADSDMTFTDTGTPADNYPDTQRLQFCGPGTAGSNAYITEFHIPTPCTQPLAITSDPGGGIWFMQTNTGNVARFDPASGSFSEYENPAWPAGGRSQVWGMDYSPDNSIWYSDEAHDSVWKFSIDDENYRRFNFPSDGDPFPQRLAVDGSRVIVNDFLGNKLTVMDASSDSRNSQYISVPSPVEQSVTAGFAQDSESNVWYTNWLPGRGGVLVKFDLPRYSADLPGAAAAGGDAEAEGPDLDGYLDISMLPETVTAVNGVAVDGSGRVWLADTASSSFYGFDPASRSFTRYVTSPVHEAAYGNQTGMVLSAPLSRPYWADVDDAGRVVFNEHAANRIGIFDPLSEKLTEYVVPSKNPLWADCGDADGCGIAQVFDFTLVGDEVWFTEWAANNIGVLDTSVEPAFDVDLVARDVVYGLGSFAMLRVTAPGPEPAVLEVVSNSPAPGSILLFPDVEEVSLPAGGSGEVRFGIYVADFLPSGEYKVLVGAQDPEVSVSQFFTLIVDRPQQDDGGP